MKKLRLLTVLFALFSILSLTACETQQQRDQKAIQSVFEQLDKATSALSTNIDDNKMDWNKAQQQYQSTLSNIDLLKCPADFQSVFLDYIDVYDETIRFANNYKENYWTYGLMDGLHFWGSVAGLSKEVSPYSNQRKEQLEKLSEAFTEVKKVGLRYGVQYKSK